MPTYTAKQQASMAKLKAANKANPLSAQNQVKVAASSGDKYGIAKAASSATKKADLKSVPQTDVRAPGEAFNPIQDLQRSQMAASKAGLPAGGFNPVVAPTVNAEQLGQTPAPVTVPTAPVDDSTAFANSLLEGDKTGTDIYQKRLDELNKQFEPENKEAQAINERLKKIIGEQKSSQDVYEQSFQKELQRGGDPEVQKKLADLNVQIANRTADYNTRIAGLPGQGRGITTGIVAAQTDREKRMALVELGNLATLKLAYQENIQAARDVALQTVNFMYKDEERSINNQLTLLQLNRDSFDRKEKQLADQRAMILQDRQNAIDQQKSEILAIKNLAIDAAQKGAPTDVAQKMANARSISEAISLGGQYLSEVTGGKRETQVIEVDGVKRLIDSQTGEVIGTYTGSMQDAGQSSNIDTFMDALSGQESGGNYNARNERTGAFGKFQIMPANWPSWSSEAGLPSGAPQTPENQELVAKFKLNQYYQKYGNWADVASVWYSGRPFSQVEAEGWADKPQGPSGKEPSVRQYVQSVLSKLPKQTTTLSQNTKVKLNKEVAESGAYKALNTASTSLQLLNNFEDLFHKYGNQRFGTEATELSTAYNKTILNLKEFFNLGVLNGPDLDLMKEILIDPTQWFGLSLKGGEEGIQSSIDEVRSMLEDHVKGRYSDLMTSYQDYDKSQLTNLQNADRAYQQFILAKPKQ